MSDQAPKATLSWLVRCWEEVREDSRGAPVARCFIRDLRTGEERYLTDPRELGELLLQRLRAAQEEPDEAGQDGSLTAG
jgi:hypothetical protein